MKIRELIEHCRGHRLYIQTHNFPDPDAIASALGLQRLFAHYDVPSTICYVGRIDRINTRKMTALCGVEMRSYQEIEAEMDEADYIICVDTQKGAGNIDDLKGDEIACIDHHEYVEVEGLVFHDVRKVGACATLVLGYYEELGVEPDTVTATALLYGLKMDTLNFTRGVTEMDIHAFSYLLRRVDAEMLGRLERDTMEAKDLKPYGAAIENIKLYGRLGMTMIPMHCPDALIAIVSDFILALGEADVAVVYAKRSDGIKFSVRSEVPSEVNAAHLVSEALQGVGDGGGHAFMAGGLIPAENVEMLGADPDARIRERFLRLIPAGDA